MIPLVNVSMIFIYWGRAKNFNSNSQKQSSIGVLLKTEAVAQTCGRAPATLLKKRLWHRCFPVNFAKFLTTPFFTEHLWWLLLWKCTLKYLQNSRETTVPASLLKRDSWTCVFPWILWNPSAKGCFWILVYRDGCKATQFLVKFQKSLCCIIWNKLPLLFGSK